MCDTCGCEKKTVNDDGRLSFADKVAFSLVAVATVGGIVMLGQLIHWAVHR